jgi:hypothetical protein
VDGRIKALLDELAYCEQTGNPRAGQVRDALAVAGHPAAGPEAAAQPPRRGPGRPRKETAADTTPKERA